MPPYIIEVKSLRAKQDFSSGEIAPGRHGIARDQGMDNTVDNAAGGDSKKEKTVAVSNMGWPRLQ